MSPYTVATMLRARELRTDGWSHADIARLIEQETGRRPSRDSVRRWTDEKYRERKNAQVAESQRVAAARAAGYRLPSDAPEYRAAFILRLRAEGVPWSSIARVCCVVFGGRWSRERVQAMASSRRFCGDSSFLPSEVVDTQGEFGS